MSPPVWRDTRSLRLQAVAYTTLFAALVGLLLVGGVHLSVGQASSRDAERVLQERTHSVSDGVRAASTNGLSVPPSLIDPGVAVYDSRGSLVAGEVPGALAPVFADLSTTRSNEVRSAGERDLVGARRFQAGDVEGVVVVAESMAPYERTERIALTVSTLAAVIVTGLAALAAAWASRRVLIPVADMARTAREWSERDLDQRFGLVSAAPRNEIDTLASTLDGLLDKVAHAIHAEQRLTSELAHELRTPLTAVLGTAELIAMRDDLDDQLREDVESIHTACRAMSSTITSLVDLARLAPGEGREHSDLVEIVRDACAETCLGIHVTMALPDGLRLAMSGALAIRALSPVLANAARHAHEVTVTAATGPGQVVVRVSDDGPGVSRADAERIFLPGHSRSGGSGLGLPLARRIARTVGGDVSFVPTDQGAVFEIRLPAT